MENKEIDKEGWWREMEKSHRRGKITGGLFVVAVGSLFLARELGAQLPEWLFSWHALLIGLGLVIGVKHRFAHPGWFVLMGIGGAFLINDLYPEFNLKPILWPALLIVLGLYIIFKPRRRYSEKMRKHWGRWQQRHHERWQNCEDDFRRSYESDKDDFIDSTSIMAGIKKNILSKKFKGGDVTTIFGGTELNMMQADIEESASLEMTQVFGGAKLIVPANWQVKSELVAIFGSVEDKRPVQQPVANEQTKLLKLTGTTIFGGIEIRSY